MSNIDRWPVPSHSPVVTTLPSRITTAKFPDPPRPAELPLVLRVGGPIPAHSPPGTAQRSVIFAPLTPTIFDTATVGGAIAGGNAPTEVITTASPLPLVIKVGEGRIYTAPGTSQRSVVFAPLEPTAPAPDVPVLPFVIRVGGPLPPVQTPGTTQRSVVFAPLTPTVVAPVSPLPLVTRVGGPIPAIQSPGRALRSTVYAPLTSSEEDVGVGFGGHHRVTFAGGHPFHDGGVYSFGPSSAIRSSTHFVPERGGAIAGGTGPTARVTLTSQGVPGSGHEPIVPQTVQPTFGGALAGGNAPAAIVPAGTGAAIAQGSGPAPHVILTAQGAIATGHGPQADPLSDSPPPGGATATGLGPTVKISLTSQGALASGVDASAVIRLALQGIVASGTGPLEVGSPFVYPPAGGAIAGGYPPTVLAGELTLGVIDPDTLTLTPRDDCLVETLDGVPIDHLSLDDSC